MATEPIEQTESIEGQWDDFTGETEETTAPVETGDVETDDTETDDTAEADDASDDDLEDDDSDEDVVGELRQQMAQLQQQNVQMAQYLAQMQQQPPRQEDSILEWVEQQLATAMLGTNLAVQQNRLTPEDARETEAQLRSYLTREAVKRAGQSRQQQQAQRLPQPITQPQDDPQWIQATKAELNQMLTTSGLKTTDPEYALIPKNFTDANPYDSLRLMQNAIVTAKRAKQARLGLGNARRNPVRVDMGGGAGMIAQDAESLSKMLNVEFAKTTPDFDRIAKLSAALENELPH